MGNTYRFARQAPRARPRTPRPRLSRPGRKSCLFVRAGSWWSAKRKRRTRKARFRFGRRYRRRYRARRSGRIRKRRPPCHRRNRQCYRIACCLHPPPASVQIQRRRRPPRLRVPVHDFVFAHHVRVVFRRAPHQVPQLEVYEVGPHSTRVVREDKELVIRRHLGDGGTQPVQRCGVEIQVDVVFILRHSFLAVPIPGVLQPGPGNSLDVPAVLKLA